MALALGALALGVLACLATADLVREFLDAHNAVRTAVGVVPLVWNDSVALYAQDYVKVLRDTKNCTLVHSHGNYGENLYGWWGYGVPHPTPTDAVSLWVDERQYYDYNTNTCTPGKVCGHYTQVVWNKSKLLGCAYLNCNSNQVVVSCNYFPPGNYIGQKPY